MALIKKIRQSVEAFTDLECIYHDGGEIGRLIDRSPLPCAYMFLLTDAQEVEYQGQSVERADVAVFFCDKTDFDFDSADNEEIIQRCRRSALQWLQGLRGTDVLRVLSVGRSERVYDQFDVIVTGFGLRLTLEEVEGVSTCTFGERERVLKVERNGVYSVFGYDVAEVAVPLGAAWVAVEEAEIGGAVSGETLTTAAAVEGETIEAERAADGELVLYSTAEAVGEELRLMAYEPQPDVERRGVVKVAENGTINVADYVWLVVDVKNYLTTEIEDNVLNINNLNYQN